MNNNNISPEQCRAARAYLNWSQPDLAERAGLTVNPILNFEKGTSTPAARTMRRIIHAFELAGIVFTAHGVEKRDDSFTVLEGENANFQLLADIYESLRKTGGEVLIAGLAEPAETEKSAREFLVSHLERLKAAGITERLLIEEGDTNLIAPAHWYRWVSKDHFSATPFQLYGDKLALIDWGPPQRIVLIHHKRFASTFRNLFDAVWRHAALVDLEGKRK